LVPTGGFAIENLYLSTAKGPTPMPGLERDLAALSSERKKRRNSPLNPVRKRKRGLGLGKTFYEIHPL